MSKGEATRFFSRVFASEQWKLLLSIVILQLGEFEVGASNVSYKILWEKLSLISR